MGFKKHNPGCRCCGCNDGCAYGATIASLTLTIAGFTTADVEIWQGVAAAADRLDQYWARTTDPQFLATFNGDYVLDRLPGCLWSGIFPEDIQVNYGRSVGESSADGECATEPSLLAAVAVKYAWVVVGLDYFELNIGSEFHTADWTWRAKSYDWPTDPEPAGLYCEPFTRPFSLVTAAGTNICAGSVLPNATCTWTPTF